MKRARSDVWFGARALMAYRRCEDSDAAWIGAAMECEYQAAIVELAKSMARVSSG